MVVFKKKFKKKITENDEDVIDKVLKNLNVEKELILMNSSDQQVYTARISHDGSPTLIVTYRTLNVGVSFDDIMDITWNYDNVNRILKVWDSREGILNILGDYTVINNVIDKYLPDIQNIPVHLFSPDIVFLDYFEKTQSPDYTTYGSITKKKIPGNLLTI